VNTVIHGYNNNNSFIYINKYTYCIGKQMRLHHTLSGKKDKKTPIWFMRQAGRYLPEYNDLRKSEPDFISYCLNSEKATKATLQPIQRFDLDAAIIFSDILMIPWAINIGVRFVAGEGPKLTPLRSPHDINTFSSDDLEKKLAPVGKAIEMTRKSLDAEKSLIGFCGAPWTVATYMIEGGTSKGFERSRHWLWKDPERFEYLIDRLVSDSIRLLTMQVKSGADVLMVFDSWASAVPSEMRERFITTPMRKITDGLKNNGVTVPVIGFPKGVGEYIIPYTENSGISGLGLDHGVDISWADRNLPKSIAVQGNLDPFAVVAGGREMLKAADHILDVCASRPHIFNLGHGLNPDTPPEHVATLVQHIRSVS
jgi:uroporphyrinogen decarboxylase